MKQITFNLKVINILLIFHKNSHKEKSHLKIIYGVTGLQYHYVRHVLFVKTDWKIVIAVEVQIVSKSKITLFVIASQL